MKANDDWPASEREAAADYRPIDPLAIVAIVAAILSALVALVGQFSLSWLPALLSAFVAIASLWRIHLADRPLSGRRLAAAAMVVSVAALAASAAYQTGRRMWARSEAVELGDAWVEHLRQNRRRAAHELTLPLAIRCPREHTLAHCYANDPDRREALERYLEAKGNDAVRQMLAWGRRATIERIGAKHLPSHLASDDNVGLIYRIEVAAGGEQSAEVRYFNVRLERSIDRSSRRPFWRIASQRLSAEPAE